MSDDNPDNDIALFLEAIGDAKSLTRRHVHLQKTPPKPKPRQYIRDESAVMDELLSDPSEIDLLDSGEHFSYTSAGVQKAVLRKLKNGKYAITAELDLHGYTQEQAREELVGFIKACRDHGRYCVRIIHGKGRRLTTSTPILKPSVNHWLRHHKRVLAFCSAPQYDGGTGAVYVLLKKS